MDQETVRTICYLARLQIDEDKAQKIESDLEAIIEMIGVSQDQDFEVACTDIHKTVCSKGFLKQFSLRVRCAPFPRVRCATYESANG